MNINILDCTLRDGGYYNNWSFNDEFVQKYIFAISKYVNVVELGLRLLKSENYKGPLAFTKDKWLTKFNLPSNVKYAVMINAADFKNSKNINKDIDHLFPLDASKSKLSLVRIASRYSDFCILDELLSCLKSKGFEVAVNLMQISEYSKEDLINICDEINVLSPSIFYMADSLGSLNPENIENIFEIISSKLKIPIGIHAHDNMGLAKQNTIKAFNLGASYLDSTLLGMGRGAGNAKTEEIILELFYSKREKYSIIHLFEFLHNYMKPLKLKYNWGGDYLYMLSALHKIHPSLVQYLANDKRYSMSDIINIFNFLKNIDAKNISVSQIDQIEAFSYSNFQATNTINEIEKYNLPDFDNIILIGSGNSAIEYKSELKNFVDENNCLLVTLNSLCPFTRKDFHIKAACNPMRFIADKDYYINCDEILLLPNQLINSIDSKNKKIIKYDINIIPNSFLFSEKSCTLPNPLSLFYALCFLLTLKQKKIFLAGIDGYNKGDQRNSVIDNIFEKLSNKVETKLIAITPSIHKNIMHDSVFNF